MKGLLNFTALLLFGAVASRAARGFAAGGHVSPRTKKARARGTARAAWLGRREEPAPPALQVERAAIHETRYANIDKQLVEIKGEIKTLEGKMEGKIEKLEKTIKEGNEKLEKQIKEETEKLEKQIKTLEEKITQQIKTLEEKLVGDVYNRFVTICVGSSIFLTAFCMANADTILAFFKQ
jgi:flagellar motility protein MotE (MotC chaperone)